MIEIRSYIFLLDLHGVSSEKKSTAIKLYFSRHEPTATVPWAWLVYEYDVYVAGNYSHPSSSFGIQYSFKTLKITYCCMRGYLQKYLHKFHKVK